MPVNRKTQARLDPRDPLVLDTRELGRRPGSMRRLSLPVPAPAGFGLELVGVPAGAQLLLDLRLESVMEGVLVSGTVTTAVTGECARCLDPVSDEVVAEVQELFAYPDSATQETTSKDEVSRLEGDYLDLEPATRDAVLLALPLIPLCREDCLGLCATCGERRDTLPPEHSHDQVDPRWAPLQEASENRAQRGSERDEGSASENRAQRGSERDEGSASENRAQRGSERDEGSASENRAQQDERQLSDNSQES